MQFSWWLQGDKDKREEGNIIGISANQFVSEHARARVLAAAVTR